MKLGLLVGYVHTVRLKGRHYIDQIPEVLTVSLNSKIGKLVTQSLKCTQTMPKSENFGTHVIQATNNPSIYID